MENRVFKLESSAVSYDMIFSDGSVSVSMIRKLKECRYDQVTKVIQKHTTFGGGDELSFRIFFMENGTEKTFPWVQARVNSENTKACLEFMKQVFPATVEWTDQRTESKTDASGRKQYDMQFLPLGYAGAGLPRGLQLWIYMIGLGVLIFPLIYIAKVLATGGYRVYTNNSRIEIKKFGSHQIEWNNVDKIDLTNVKVVDQNNYSSNHVMRFQVSEKSGKRSKFVMRLDHAVPLLKEMAEHQVVSEELIKKYA
jgi:hypothetical protein